MRVEDMGVMELRRALLLPVFIYDEDTMDEVANFYAPSPPRVGEDFRGRTVVNVAWNHTETQGTQVHVYAKKSSDGGTEDSPPPSDT